MNRLPVFLLFLAVAAFVAADLILDYDFNWIDYVIVVLLALFGYRGYLKGFVNTIFSFAGYILGLIGAYIFSPKLALIFMQKTAMGKVIGERINHIIPALASVNTGGTGEPRSVMDILSKNPALNDVVSGNHFIKRLITLTADAAETGSMYEDTVQTLNDYVVFAILKVISLILLFIVIKLLIVLIGRIMTSVLGSTAILGTANRTFGMLLGFATGLLICYVIFMLAVPVLGSMNIIKSSDAFDRSVLMNWFSNYLSSAAIRNL